MSNLRRSPAVLMVLAITFAGPGPTSAQTWVEAGAGAGPGDSGSGTNAIALREYLYPWKFEPLGAGLGGLRYNHPADMEELTDGTQIIMWDGGNSEGDSINKLWATRKSAGGTWSDPFPIDPNVERTSNDIGVIYQPKNNNPRGRVIAWYHVAGGPETWRGAVSVSDDSGLTWSPRRMLPMTTDPDFRARGGILQGPEMNQPWELPDGSLIGATSIFRNPGPTGKRERIPIIVRIPANNWTGAEPGGSAWAIEKYNVDRNNNPNNDRTSQGAFLFLDRARSHIMWVNRGSFAGEHNFVESTDGGNTFGATWKLLPGNVCGSAGVGAVSLDLDGGPCQGWHLMAGSHPNGKRNALTVAISNRANDPASWRQVLLLNQMVHNEDADPSLFQSRRDRKVHLIFSGRGVADPALGNLMNTALKHYVFDADRLCGSPGGVGGSGGARDSGMGGSGGVGGRGGASADAGNAGAAGRDAGARDGGGTDSGTGGVAGARGGAGGDSSGAGGPGVSPSVPGSPGSGGAGPATGAGAGMGTGGRASGGPDMRRSASSGCAYASTPTREDGAPWPLVAFGLLVARGIVARRRRGPDVGPIGAGA